MSKHLKLWLAAAILGVGLAAAPAIYAHDSNEPDGSMKGPGMMGQDRMMGQMSAMMQGCTEMMQAMMEEEHGAQPPTERRQERSPEQPRPEGDAG